MPFMGPPPITPKFGSVSLTHPSVEAESNDHEPHPPQARVRPLQAQAPVEQVLFGPHLVPQAPQLLASVCLLTQLPQFAKPDAQQMLPPVPEEQLPLWHRLLLLHVPPFAVFETHVPPPSQTMPVVPQLVPAAAFAWLVQTSAPVAQLFVPGLQVAPQVPPGVQATQVPLPSQT